MISCTVHDENTQIQQVEKKTRRRKISFFLEKSVGIFLGIQPHTRKRALASMSWISIMALKPIRLYYIQHFRNCIQIFSKNKSTFANT
jgi:hypothetical protein